MESCRVLVSTFGSQGDIYPLLGLALELQERGHCVTFATNEWYRKTIEEQNITFASVRPDIFPRDPDFVKQSLDERKGAENYIRNMISAHVRETYKDLLPYAKECDLIISSSLNFAAPLVAEKLGKPWISSVLSPSLFLSVFEPPPVLPYPFLSWLRRLGKGFNRILIKKAKQYIDEWTFQIKEFRRELGLKERGSALYEIQNSPFGVLALFSKLFGCPQPDWPENVCQPGFIFRNFQKENLEKNNQLSFFLKSGQPPVVFSLGSTAVDEPGDFYQMALLVSKKLGIRCVLLAGKQADRLKAESSSEVFITDYACHATLFPKVRAVVHSGGVGTTAEVLKAGVPMLVVPFANDQHDNAERVERMGVGLQLKRSQLTKRSLSRALQKLLSRPEYSLKALRVGVDMLEDSGVFGAADEVERVLQTVSKRRSELRERA